MTDANAWQGREPYKLLDLFSGIGGFSLGLERTGGFKTVAVSEIDPYASRVLEQRIGAPNIGNVETAEFPDADFICAGFPCQDISFAGHGAGLAGSRSGLWRHVVRAIRVVRPKGVLLENVAALRQRGLGTVLGDLAEVRHDAEWHCIPASAVGAPHQRDRIWIYSYPDSEQHESARSPISGQIADELSRTAADTETLFRFAIKRSEPDGDHAGAGEVADAGDEYVEGIVTGRSGEEVWQKQGERPFGPRRNGAGWWSAEPDVGRVAHGVSKRVDRLRCLGNAVVPQIPELIGHAILSAEREAA